MMPVFLLAMGLMPRNHNNVLFALLYALTLFFASLHYRKTAKFRRPK
jgi:hypothetical protein